MGDKSFAQTIESMYPGITKAVSSGPRGAFRMQPPTEFGLTWHHSFQDRGFLELIARKHHVVKGPVQGLLHPNQKGGQYAWGEGLSPEARRDWNKLRVDLNKARAEAELLRGVDSENTRYLT